MSGLSWHAGDGKEFSTVIPHCSGFRADALMLQSSWFKDCLPVAGAGRFHARDCSFGRILSAASVTGKPYNLQEIL